MCRILLVNLHDPSRGIPQTRFPDATGRPDSDIGLVRHVRPEEEGASDPRRPSDVRIEFQGLTWSYRSESGASGRWRESLHSSVGRVF